MSEIYILKFIEKWGPYKPGQIKITNSKTTREALVITHKVVIEMAADEKPRDSAKWTHPTPEKSPDSPIPGSIPEKKMAEIIRPRPHRRGR